MFNSIALGIAVILDLLFGEPKKEIHPTVWFGKLASFFDRRYRRRGRVDLFAGALFSSIVIIFAVALSLLPNLLIQPFSTLVSAFLLKTTFSIKSLDTHVRSTVVQELEEKRRRVSMIVSRETANLSEEELNSAAIESLSENLVDSVISPIFYFLILGLPGALLYRAVNTLDAMIGYRNERYEFFGKFAARFDDVLSFIPARISVFLFLPLSKRVWSFYRMAKFKLNGDKPISAMSAVLEVKLEKKGAYSFPGKKPSDLDVLKALKVSKVVISEWLLLAFLILGSSGLWGGG
jgi:adenosylcobinamide-phosphate synthase